MKPKRIPGKRVVWIGGRPVVLSDKEWREFTGGILAKEKKIIKALGKGKGK